MKLEWSELAISDREAIFEYIEADSAPAAITIDDRIENAIDRLARFPESGRIGRVDGTRELIIPGTSYLAVYLIRGNTVRVLRVLHGAQLWPDENI